MSAVRLPRFGRKPGEVRVGRTVAFPARRWRGDGHRHDREDLRVLAGEITIALEGGRVERLGPLDSCHLAAGETRAVRNDQNQVATMLVIVPGPDRPA